MKSDQKIFFSRLGRFTPVGHRGANGEIPGNTMESFQRLIDIFPGAMIELDVWETRDGEIAVFHDDLLDHETSGSGPVSLHDYRDLTGMDRAYKISHDGGRTFPFRGKGYRIPLLKDVLGRFPRSPVSIDIKCHKMDFARKVMALVNDLGARDRVIIGSFSGRIISQVRRKYPGVATSCGRNEVILFYVLNRLFLWRLFRFLGDALMIPEFTDTERPEFLDGTGRQGLRIITPGFIKRAHHHNVPVFAWTINSRENMRRLISWGIDGIVTDYPALLKEVMTEEGML